MREGQRTGRRGIAPTIRARIFEGSDRFWRPEDFDGLRSPNAVDQTLSDLHAAGELRRVRRGLYWRGPRTAFGVAPPPTRRILEQITGLRSGIGPSGYSAALAVGISTQVPRVETYALPIRTPTGLPDGIRVVSRAARRGRLDAKLRPLEVAWLEIAERWEDHVSDSAEAARLFGAAIDAGTIRADRITAASRTEPPVVKRNIATLLRAAGMATDASQVPLRALS